MIVLDPNVSITWNKRPFETNAESVWKHVSTVLLESFQHFSPKFRSSGGLCKRHSIAVQYLRSESSGCWAPAFWPLIREDIPAEQRWSTSRDDASDSLGRRIVDGDPMMKKYEVAVSGGGLVRVSHVRDWCDCAWMRPVSCCTSLLFLIWCYSDILRLILMLMPGTTTKIESRGTHKSYAFLWSLTKESTPLA